jgi:iron complex outermembrane receptor protein
MKARLYALIGILTAASTAAGARDSRLDPANLTASRSAGLTDSLAAGVITLDREAIERSEATHLAELLDSVGGIDTRERLGVNGSRARIDLQGFGAGAHRNTLILLNGQRYSNADASVPDLDALPLAAIERIEILPGAGSALYGHGAAGGTINIVTRRDDGNAAGGRASTGDFSRRGGGAWATGSNGPLGGAVAAEVLNTDGYRDNNQLRQHNGFMDLRARAGSTKFSLTGTFEDQQLEMPGGRSASFVTNNTDFANDPRGADTPRDWADQQGFTLSPRATIPLGENAALHLDAARRHDSRQVFEAANTAPYSETDIDSYNLNPRLVVQGSTAGLRNHLTLGWDQYRYEYKRRDAASERGLSSPASLNRVDQEQDGWYLHDLVTLNEQWSLSLGARELRVDTDSRDLAGNRSRSETDEAMYEGGVRYAPLDTFSLFAGAQRSVRIPDADEIRSGDPADLRAQTGHTHTAGASWAEGNQHSRLTFWRGRFDHEILFDPNAGGGSGAHVNLDNATVRKGVSLNSRWELDDNLMVTLNGSYQHAVFQNGPYANDEIPLVPNKNAYIRADWQALSWLRVSLAHRYSGRRYLDGDPANRSRRLDSYHRSDLILRAEDQGLFLEAGVYNLEDHRAADYGVRTGANTYKAWPLPGKHVIMTVGFKL